VSVGWRTSFEQHLLDALPDLVILLAEDGEILQVNRSAEQFTGWRPGQLAGRNVTELLHHDDLAAVTEVCDHAPDDEEPARAAEVRLRGSDGEWCRVEIVANNLLDTEIGAVIVCARNLAGRPTHDPLTGLATPRLVERHLDDAIAGRGRAGVVLVDLDAFQALNERHGRPAGDRVLQVVAERLQGSVRGVDVVGRWGDDEFVLVCSNLSAPDGLSWIARRIVATIPEPIVLPDGVQLRPTASVGAALQSPELNTVEALVRAAESAVYDVKRAGRDGWQVHGEAE
jgi:diguanylate cyclase (GGDEF)-like protein/PAS domain S-box-containing protein